MTKFSDNEVNVKSAIPGLPFDEPKEYTKKDFELFAGIASHELKEPLRTLFCYAQLLEKNFSTDLKPEAREHLLMAALAAKRMYILVEDLSLLGQPLNPAELNETVDCNFVIEEVLQDTAILIKEKKAIVRHWNMPIVKGSRIQIYRLFLNLLSNSLKFQSTATPIVEITSRQVGTDWLFSIRDNGIGIAPDQKESIFKMFHKGHTQLKYPGLGIGLALCKKVVEDHGGKIWTETETEKGSVFFFTIPSPAGMSQRSL